MDIPNDTAVGSIPGDALLSGCRYHQAVGIGPSAGAHRQELSTYTKILPPLRETRGPGKPPSEEEVLGEIRAATGVHSIVPESEAEAAADQAADAQPAAAVGKRGSNPYS